MNKLPEIRQREIEFGPVAQLGERTVRIREVRGFDPLRVHQCKIIRTLDQSVRGSDFLFLSRILRFSFGIE